MTHGSTCPSLLAQVTQVQSIHSMIGPRLALGFDFVLNKIDDNHKWVSQLTGIGCVTSALNKSLSSQKTEELSKQRKHSQGHK